MNKPQQLRDAWTRLYRARENYEALHEEALKFLYEYVKGMNEGWDTERETFVLRFRKPEDSILTGRPRALVVDIVEDLRSALDYMVFELSALNETGLNERTPQFVIADTKEAFDDQSKTRLRYLTDEQRTQFIEKLQPFNGNHLLGVLRDLSNQSKHRRLLSVRDRTSWDIHLAPADKSAQFQGYFMYPVEKDHTVFARPKSPVLLLLENYDAFRCLHSLAEQVGQIVRFSHPFFEGRPFKMEVIPPQPE